MKIINVFYISLRNPRMLRNPKPTLKSLRLRTEEWTPR